MAISQKPPALPPRPNVGTSEHVEFSTLGKTPPVWLYSLIHNTEDDDHQHEFYLSTEFDDEFETVFLCQKCHNWFHLTTIAPNASGSVDFGQGICVYSDNNLHHLHTPTASKTNISANCCQCQFVVNIEIKDPFIDMRLFHNLSKIRRRTMSYANVVRRPEFSEYQTSLVEIINDMIQIVNSILDGDLNTLNFKCETFELDEVSQTIFKMLEFEIMDGRLSPPSSLLEYEKINIKKAKEELIMSSFELSSHLKNGAKKPYEKLNAILGTTYKPRFNGSYANFGSSSGARSLQPSYLFLGCMSDMDDQTLIWAYRSGIHDNPEKTPQYLQAILDISKEKKSEALQELVQLERSEGKFSDEDVKEAYKCLEISDSDVSIVSDDYLLQKYVTLTNERHYSRAEYRDALLIIGKLRNSATILNYINEKPVNEMFDFFSEMPVGLDNIGNTCYLNSLLQYYFTIRRLRKVVLETDDANGHGLEWHPITIGHRKVSKSEVERAKKFVALLRGLFVNLIHSSQKSITPDVDLAYLALVNAKNDEDEYKDTSKSPMNVSNASYDNKMVIDDPSSGSPGPSSKSMDYVTSELNDHTESEEVTVELEGIAPPADAKNDDTIIPENFYQQSNEFNASHSLKGKEKENIQSYGPDLPPDFFNTTKEDKLRAASEMLFGRQQDVTECMDNVMFQLEAALKSPFMVDESGDEQNIIKSLFYGQTRQFLHKDQKGGEPLTKEESFNHLIVVAAEGRDLYDALDVYFDASMVDYDGTQAIREVTVTKIPPILQIHVQRVQFDRSTYNVYKSNAFLRFDKVIYLDRYLDKNYEVLKQRRAEAHGWKQEIDRLQAGLKDFERDKATMLSTVELLDTTVDFVTTLRNDIEDENFDWNLSVVKQESNHINEEAEEYRSKISHLRSQLKQNYQDLQECEYRLHAVFIHSGQANFGHYWIYIFDFEKDRWLKFNDSYVTEVGEDIVFADTTGSSANPYCMVYVRAQDAKELVETVCRSKTN